MKYKNLYQIILLTFLMCSFKGVFATQAHTGMWLDASTYGTNDAKKWGYTLEGQLRLLDEKDKYELYYLQGRLGFYATPNMSLWSGYQWVSSSSLDNSAGQNIIFEELFWQFFTSEYFELRSHTRLEQINVLHQPQWENRLRQQFNVYFPNIVSDKITPYFFNEIFVKLNDPSWDYTENFIQQNAFFAGAFIEVSKTWFFKVGYHQQYVFEKQDNHIDNILYVGINYNPSMVPTYRYIR